MMQCPGEEHLENLDPKPRVIYSVLYLSLIKQQREGNSIKEAADGTPGVAPAGSHSGASATDRPARGG